MRIRLAPSLKLWADGLPKQGGNELVVMVSLSISS